ncbi:hypothetical protein [Georgenia muralis]
MTDTELTPTRPGDGAAVETLVDKAKDVVQTDGFQAQIFKAISVQRPAVLEYLRSLRRDKPNASATELLKELDRRYVATVTATSTGVGASAAIPGVGIPVALGLGVADLLFFYETSALYVLAVAELHGIEVSDAARAQPLVFGMLLGEKSQSQVTKVVLGALPVGSTIDDPHTVAAGVLGSALPDGWGEVLTQQLPDSALAPVLTVLAREALKNGAKLGAGTLGKTVPFGVGAVIGGVGSFTFGRDVVKAARAAFPEPPADFPAVLADFQKPEPMPAEPSRAVTALQAAAGGVANFGEDIWGTATRATEVFRSVDLDGDGIPDEARALTAVKGAGSAVKGAAAGAAGAVGGVFRRRRDRAGAADDAPQVPAEDSTEP